MREWLRLIKKDVLEKGVLRLGFKRLQSFSNEGTRTSLGVQCPGGPVVMPLFFQCRLYHFNAWS